jgi:diketogulonate reductase-like aldo/keto reductase
MHSYNPEFPLKDSIRALDKLVSEGLIRNIGVSNFNKEHLAEAQSYTENKIVCDQVHYNLEFREPESSGLLDYCQNNDVFLVAWRPVGKGNLLTQVPIIITTLCEKYQKTPAQIVLNWLISQPNVLTLSKTRNPNHLKENLGAIGWQMEPTDIEAIRKGYPDQKMISDVVSLA